MARREITVIVHLLSTIDSSYLIPFRVTVHSLVASKSPEVQVRWHICDSGLSSRDRAEIEDLRGDASVEFVWHDLSAAETLGLPIRGRAVPKMYERLLAPDLLKDETERFIYLDGDLLVLDRIDALWDIDLEGAILGAVQDLAVPLVSSPMGLRLYEELGFAKDAPYFNTGVYVADIESWNKNEVGLKALEYLDRHRESVNLMDQDALNAILGDRWQPIDYRWNLTGGLVSRAHYKPWGVDSTQLQQAIANPGIVHFSGYLKPWTYPRLGSPWAKDYVETLVEACPGHRLEQTTKARGVSFYDRELREFLYPLEKLVWKTKRGF